MAKKNPAEPFHLVCQECKSQNYTQLLKKEHKGLKIKKYCPGERKKTEHAAKKA